MLNKSVLFVRKISPIARWSSQVRSSSGSYIHNPGSEPLTYDTIGNVLQQSVEKYPNRVAVRSVQEGVTLTYEELLSQADSLAYALRAQGLVKGDRFGIWSHNSIAWFVATVAAARAGLISVLINPMYERNEIGFCIRKTQMKSLLIGETLPRRNYYEKLQTLIPELDGGNPASLKSKEFPSLTSVISYGNEKLTGTYSYKSLVTDYQNRNEISQYRKEVTPQDGSIIHFTSGTTGDPKAALDSHLGVINNSYFIGKRNMYHEEHHNICIQVPLFHGLGSVITVMAGLRHGSSFVLAAPIYNVDDNIKALFEEKCTAITGTPTMYVDILSQIKQKAVEVPSYLKVALTAGAPCSPQFIRDMQKYLKAEYVQALYGMTETTASVFQSVPGDSIEMVSETVGYIHDHVEAKVIDENGNMVPFGSPGELIVRGFNNMICYWDEPEKTNQSFCEDGWLRTGDKFTISEDGYGRIVGRIKDIIIRGGENIAPKEIEDILNTHPDIIESQVVGVSDDRLGEELCAVLKIREGASIKLDDVTKHLTGRIAKFKIPKLLRVADEFPKTGSGKIQKYKLIELIESGKL